MGMMGMNSVESLIVKWTIGSSFGAVVLLFAGKMIVLFRVYFDQKLTGALGWLNSPDTMKTIGVWIWECIKIAGKGVMG